jgi:hypothetical protein
VKLKSQSRSGFGLMETILGMLVLALSVVGSFEALRLSDLQARRSRIDHRVTELLRENSDYVMYVAFDLLPADGAVLSQGSLCQQYDLASKSWQRFYNYTITAHVQASNPGTASETRTISLSMTFQADGDSPSAPLKSQTIITDAVSRQKS